MATKGTTQSTTAKKPAKTTVKATTKTATKPSVKAKKAPTPSTTFSLYAPEAREVFLIGDFNDWQTDNLKAKKFKDGTWKKSVQLKPGIYHYLFLVDGQWWTDPANQSRMRNPFGTENSVVEVK